VKYDVIIVGSGAGGCASAWQLACRGVRVLLVERGPRLARDGSTLDTDTVFRRKAFLADERWNDASGAGFVPQERFNLGGKTKWYGAALMRFDPREFDADPDHACPGWPISYAEIQPWYELAEHLLGVRRFEIEPDLARIVTGLRAADSAWTSVPLGMGLSSRILEHLEEATHFDGFASPRGLKSDGEVSLLDSVRANPNISIVVDKRVTDLLADADPLRVSGVLCEDGTRYVGDRVLLAAGALHSPQLLERYVARHGLAGRLPGTSRIGRAYKSHLLTALLAFSPRRQRDLLRKTAALFHDAFPHSSAQPLGFLDGPLLAPELPAWTPRPVAAALAARAYGFFLQTEDGSHADNRVRTGTTPGDPPVLDYDPKRQPGALAEHRRFVRKLAAGLLRMGFATVTKPIPLSGTAHACGTLAAGHDPSSSVVDSAGRVHGTENLYVVDGSALPRIGRVNPALTIYAWSLRVSSHLVEQGEQHGDRIARRNQVRA